MSLPVVAQKPVEIFISYSRKDKAYVEELANHLRPYELEKQIRVWYDRNLRPGTNWEPELVERFQSARIILLLISSDFFASDYICRRELPTAMDRHKKGQTKVIPVIIRPVNWMHLKLDRLQALPRGAIPVESWKCHDEAYAQIVSELHELLVSEFGVSTEESSSWGDAPPPSVKPINGADASDLKETVFVTYPRGIVLDDPGITPSSDEVPVLQTPEAIFETPSHHGQEPDQIAEQGLRPSAAPLPQIVPKVVVCFLHSDRRNKLLQLRKWCRDPKDPLFEGQAAHVEVRQTLKEAVAEVRMAPSESILLLDGFEPGGPQIDELLQTPGRDPPFEIIVNDPEWSRVAVDTPSSSILQLACTVSTDETLLETLRKSILRVRTRQVVVPNVVNTKQEFAEFFSLRYQVWKSENYLSPAKICPQIGWELDYTDRTSLPLGIFSKENGALVAAARLVRGFGDENRSRNELIDDMLREKGAVTLQSNFRNPDKNQPHPFDILGEMPRFKEYYCRLVRSGASKAEVSRVIVAPEWRRRGMGEVVVDTLCSLAKSRAIAVLFLACHVKHAKFYERCGFQAIPGVTGTKFMTYDGPCLAMERIL